MHTVKLNLVNSLCLYLMRISKIFEWNGSCILFFGEQPFPKE
ncbi:unknown [Firmicutes bacterium CAG:646]|nr:unknown [Firmicutes bacterium CAG:646]